MADNKEERKAEVVGDKCTRSYYFRRCKRTRLTNVELLPSDLLLEVLARVPAQDIYHRARLVCRKWYHMIHTRNFLHEHLQHTTNGLLFQDIYGNMYFVALHRGRIEISNINYKYITQVSGSCTGLFLQVAYDKNLKLCITNHVLKQRFMLPPPHVRILEPCTWEYAIAYSRATHEYKVFQTCTVEFGQPQLYFILTVGVDNSWRHLDTRHLSVEGRYLFYPVVVTEGFIHWAVDGNQVLTLNVETEVITKTPAPAPPVYERKDRKYYLSGGRHLSLLLVRNNLSFEAWEMKPETGEWRKAGSIVLEGEERRFEDCGIKEDDGYLIPYGWLKYQEVLCFDTLKGQTYIFYNLLTHEVYSFTPPPMWCEALVHKNTLSWFN